MLVRIDEEMAIEMLMNRLSHWTNDYTTHRLYRDMYENSVYGGVFEEFDVMEIVDNDYVNWCDVVSDGDEAYEDIKKLHDEQGCGDISYEDELNHGYAYIEAEYNGCFLVRS